MATSHSVAFPVCGRRASCLTAMSSPKQSAASRLVSHSNAWANCLLGLLLLFTLAWVLQQLLGMSPLFVPASLAAYSVGSAALLASMPRWLRLQRFGPANQVTLVRAVLVALVLGLVGETSTSANAWLAIGTALVVLALDGVDGWVARRYGLSSAFGARFDMETDALLILVLSLLVWQFDKAGYWVLLAGLLRYLFVGAGRWLTWLRRPLPPSRRRQTVCVLQTVILIVCLLPPVSTAWSRDLAAFGVLLLVWSFAVDIIWLARRAKPQPEEARS